MSHLSERAMKETLKEKLHHLTETIGIVASLDGMLGLSLSIQHVCYFIPIQ